MCYLARQEEWFWQVENADFGGLKVHRSITPKGVSWNHLLGRMRFPPLPLGGGEEIFSDYVFTIHRLSGSAKLL